MDPATEPIGKTGDDIPVVIIQQPPQLTDDELRALMLQRRLQRLNASL